MQMLSKTVVKEFDKSENKSSGKSEIRMDDTQMVYKNTYHLNKLGFHQKKEE